MHVEAQHIKKNSRGGPAVNIGAAVKAVRGIVGKSIWARRPLFADDEFSEILHQDESASQRRRPVFASAASVKTSIALVPVDILVEPWGRRIWEINKDPLKSLLARRELFLGGSITGCADEGCVP